ncbi:MAG: DUF1738 domain-containing protein [Bacteroidetes bacterium]|nr:DUF1738 domain-containing protein [Bacteroidota bacterium]
MKTTAKTGTKQHDLYQQVTDYVIAELGKGNVVWQKGWHSYGLPKNIISGHRYRGWNVFWLNFLTIKQEYATPYFITFKQAQEAGGHIKKGEKGIHIIFWAAIEDKTKMVTIRDASGQDKEIHPMFRVPKQHIVFNIDQTEGIVFPETQINLLSEEQRLEQCETIIRNMPQCPVIQHRGSEAFYQPSADTVTMPLFGLFHTEAEYYTTLFHELAHSTGHASRLNRKEITEPSRFGSEPYSREELTAELTAAFLCAVCGIGQQTIINSIAYLDGWLDALRNDKTLILKASTQAQAAADFILSEKDLPQEQAQQNELAA